MTHYVVPAALGIGDMVVIIPVLQSLLAQGRETVLILHSADHDAIAQRIGGLAGTVLATEFVRHDLGSGDVLLNMREHYIQEDYWWVSRQFAQAFPGYRINDIVAHICEDLGVHCNFDDARPLQTEPRLETAGKVVFVPGTVGTNKCWPTNYWRDLESRLLLLGIEAVVIGQPHKSECVRELITSGMTWHPSPTLADALDLVTSSRAIVSVDTGLMHLAVHQLKPTVGIYQHAPLYLRDAPHVFPVIASEPCLDECYVNEMRATGSDIPGAKPGYRLRDWACVNSESSCMASLRPDVVIERVREALESCKIQCQEKRTTAGRRGIPQNP